MVLNPAGVSSAHISGRQLLKGGLGCALLAVSLKAAEDASIEKIDASIANDNPEALAYYEAMGFRTYRTPDGLICKCFDLKGQTG